MNELLEAWCRFRKATAYDASPTFEAFLDWWARNLRQGWVQVDEPITNSTKENPE